MPPYEREIEALHELFVDWYCGEATEEEFDRLPATTAPSFEMITPDGNVVPREAVIEGVRDSYNKYDLDEFDIEIRNVEVRETPPEYALVRYEEWQDGPDGETGRLSTVLLREDGDAPLGLVWVELQETWLER